MPGEKFSPSFESVEAERLSNVADYVVGSLSQLKSAFSNVSAGETIYIGNEGAPYRTDEWLDLDVPGVTVVGAGQEPLVKVADGGNVGGIRVGQNSAADHTTIRGISFDGNAANQTDTTEDHTAIEVVDGDNVVIRDCYIFDTHPSAVDDGTTALDSGQGIDVKAGNTDVIVSGCMTEDTGYDGIRMLGERMVANDNITIGQDNRGISGSNNGTEGANKFIVNGNICETGPLTASAIAQRDVGGEIVVAGNHTFTRSGETGRRGIQFSSVSDIVISANYVDGRQLNDHAILVNSFRTLVIGNWVEQPNGGYGIYHGNSDETVICGNFVKDARNGNGAIRLGGGDRGTVFGNVCENPVGDGLTIAGGTSRAVVANVVRGATEHGINVANLVTDFTVSGNLVNNVSLSSNNTYDGILCDGTRGLVGTNNINGNSNARDGVRVGGNASDVSIVANRAQNVNGQAFNIDYAVADATANTPQPTADLTSVTAPSRVVYAYHDGTDGGNTNAEGPAFSPSGSTTWTSVVDGGTIT